MLRPQTCLAGLVLAQCLAACVDPEVRRGHAALGDGRYEDAVRAYESARTRLPAAEVPFERLASAHRSLAMGLTRAGDCEGARTHFLAAEALSRPVLPDYRSLYECTAARGAPTSEQAAALYADLLHLTKLGDSRLVVHRKLAHLALRLQQDVKAETHFAVLEDRQMLTWQERKDLMRLLLRLGQEDRALPYLEHVVAADPTRPLDRLKLAELYEGRHRDSEARRVYESLVLDFHQNPVVFLRAAAFFRRMGDQDAARRAQAIANGLRGVRQDDRALRPLRRSRR